MRYLIGLLVFSLSLGFAGENKYLVINVNPSVQWEAQVIDDEGTKYTLLSIDEEGLALLEDYYDYLVNYATDVENNPLAFSVAFSEVLSGFFALEILPLTLLCGGMHSGAIVYGTYLAKSKKEDFENESCSSKQFKVSWYKALNPKSNDSQVLEAVKEMYIEYEKALSVKNYVNGRTSSKRSFVRARDVARAKAIKDFNNKVAAVPYIFEVLSQAN